MTNNSTGKRIVVAGQTPPPVGGQAVMIARLLGELSEQPKVDCVHLPFFFTTDPSHARRLRFSKVVELFVVLGRLLRLRLKGPIDLLVYPIGGPQIVPIIRDILLLPFMRLATRRLAIHFHAGGVAEKLPKLPRIVRSALVRICKQTDDAIVMTEFGRGDPASLGVHRVHVVPHTIDDTFEPSLLTRSRDAPARLLYVGHFSPEKGTKALVEAVGDLRRSGFDCRLDLVGECIAPYTEQELRADVARNGLDAIIELPGVLVGREKWERFARADLFAFPSVASESFGLVLVEAMMWALPIIATDWRGTREVFHGSDGAVCFEPLPDLATALSSALRKATEHRESWAKWGEMNRSVYEEHFSAAKSPRRLGRAIEKLAREP